MTDNEQKQIEDIAILKNDMGHIRNSLSKVEGTLSLYDRHFARKDDVLKIENFLQTMHDEFKEELAKKVDNTVFEPIRKTLTRINWVLISAVVVGVLTLLFKS